MGWKDTGPSGVPLGLGISISLLWGGELGFGDLGHGASAQRIAREILLAASADGGLVNEVNLVASVENVLVQRETVVGPGARSAR